MILSSKKCLDKTLTLQVKRRCWNHAGDYDGERQTDRQTDRQTNRQIPASPSHVLARAWLSEAYYNIYLDCIMSIKENARNVITQKARTHKTSVAVHCSR